MGLITLDETAQDNGLALMLHGLFEENLAAYQAKREDFAAIRTRFALVAPDAEVQVSLWFDDGHCTVYDGVRNGTEVTITADSGKIPELSQVRLRFGLPWLLDDAGKGLVLSFVQGQIAVEGLIDLPWVHVGDTLRRLYDLLRLTRVLSVAD
ncbi:MAG TPA: hypothetical protein VH877_06010 [Polyangia bacterium]|jgi:hypothetical protein|nr:hypothetical protein [Polyangia bacterium]